MTVPGVGPLVSLTYRATVDIPARFRKSKSGRCGVWANMRPCYFAARQKGRIHTAVDARRNRHGRNATVDQTGNLNVVAALLLAYCGGYVLRNVVGWAE